MSLCVAGTDRRAGLVLRVRRPGETDAVIRSGPGQRFHTFTIEDGPHHGRDVIWVRSGSAEYCVSTAFAQGRGVGLDIFVEAQWRVRLFSGIETGVTYEVTESAELREVVKALLLENRSASCV